MVIEGVVIEGRKLGRELGFPTANMVVPETCEAQDGVYETRVEVDGVWYRAMSNLGCNPSVGGTERKLESYLFGFEGSLYGRRIRVELVRWIREELHFASVEELKAQIEADYRTILEQK